MDTVRVGGAVQAQRWLGIPLALLFAVALQSSLLASFPLFGARPELPLLVAIGVALEEGPEWGAGAGFLAGLLIDLLGVAPLGISALSFTIVGYMVGSLGRTRFQSEFQVIGVAGLATILAEVMVLGFGFLIGQGTRGVTISQILLTGAYNAALATLVLPGMRKLLAIRGGGA